MRVEVYWNLRKNCYSVRDCSTGRVVEHTNSLWIRNPVFVVRQAGREKVLRDKQKNVHAFVRGELGEGTLKNVTFSGFPDEDKRIATYNPYKSCTFVDKKTGKVLYNAKYAMLETVNNKGVIEYVC